MLFLLACSDESMMEGGASYASDAGGSGNGEGAALTAGAWDDNLNYDVFTDWLGQLTTPDGAPSLTDEERDDAHAEFAQSRPANERLDIAFTLDTTGSMGDELSYLTDELDSIAGAIEDAHPDADLRWALVVYRDAGDEYVAKTALDFSRHLADLKGALAEQSAGGGGDYPEASHAGLDETMALSWRQDAEVARLDFWVADAPHHVAREADLTAALREARDADIQLYPVAASGVDTLAELSMRSAAQVTGGEYLFLTNDSGIGDSHAEPTVPCYFVTSLADQVIRMAHIELTGIYVDPDPDDVIRTSGNPVDGRCAEAEDTGAPPETSDVALVLPASPRIRVQTATVDTMF